MIYHLFNYLKKLGWLSIQNRLEYHKSVLMYKCITNSAPDYLCNLFDMNTNSNVYSLRSYAKGNMFVPRPNSNFMKRTVLYSGTILWNSLWNSNLKLIQNIESGRFGAVKSDSTHHFFGNACTKSGSLQFSQFSGC